MTPSANVGRTPPDLRRGDDNQRSGQALFHAGIYFAPMWGLPAAFAITLVVVGFTFLGLGLEPALNPRWSRPS